MHKICPGVIPHQALRRGPLLAHGLDGLNAYFFQKNTVFWRRTVSTNNVVKKLPLSSAKPVNLGPKNVTKDSKDSKDSKNGGVLNILKRILGFTKLVAQQKAEAREKRENAANPYIQYPVVTCAQMASIATDGYRLDVGHASYAHHSFSLVPTIHSLSDLTDPTLLNTLLPRRRPHGLPVDTLSIKAGDDAMLISPTVVAIADGVSGWESRDGDCSLGIWARSMLETVSRLMTEYKLSHVPHLLNVRDIKQVLDDSFVHTSHLMDLQGLRGSSTLVLGMVSGNMLKYVSIGDLRLYVIRHGEILHSNKTLLLGHWCPTQIGTQTLAVMPSEIAVVDEIPIQENDLVVLCSDGVSDNLFDWEILEIINSATSDNLRALCTRLLAKCKRVAYDDNAYTPYNMKVNELPSTGFGHVASLGGKMDDMSLCIARVVPNPRPG